MILNPHLVIKRLHAAKTPGLSEEKFAALQERAIAIGSLDFEEEEEEEASPSSRRPRGGKLAPGLTIVPKATNEIPTPTETELPGSEASEKTAS